MSGTASAGTGRALFARAFSLEEDEAKQEEEAAVPSSSGPVKTLPRPPPGDPYALIKAASQKEKGSLAKCKELIARGGIDLNVRNKDGATALSIAVDGHSWDRDEIVRVLIQAGASLDVPDNYGFTALHKAVIAHYVEITRILVQAGASLDVQERQGKTPLAFAREFSRFMGAETVTILEDAAAERATAPAAEGHF